MCKYVFVSDELKKLPREKLFNVHVIFNAGKYLCCSDNLLKV